MNFKISHYRETLRKYKSENYSFPSTDKKNSCHKQLIMVHDVDHKLELAKNFSRVEEKEGVSSTYFLRLHAINYNIFSKKSIDFIQKELLGRNHNIGLHFEPSFYKEQIVEKSIKNSLGLLSSILDHEVKVFNIHEPVRTGYDLSRVLKSHNRCYNSVFFKDFKYLSDSSCSWREGCFSGHVNKWKKLLVLTHPIWWYHEEPSENY